MNKKLIIFSSIILILICSLLFYSNKNKEFVKSNNGNKIENVIKTDTGFVKKEEIVPGLDLILKIDKPSKNSNKLILSSILKNNTDKMITINEVSSSSCKPRPNIKVDYEAKYYSIDDKHFACPFGNLIQFSIDSNEEMEDELILFPKFPFNKNAIKEFTAEAQFWNKSIKLKFNLNSLN
ncbi:hypothetical protein [Bacillus thuringiensis]|uniref:Uncharacterized protein n=1 Tax=Bacillus thuringiensis TaxID=1428 RepID=A0A9X6ZQS0_BACTU|nr:hypothetical protein [Bacillus thuringiensis]PFJ33157.1 hypothetical protein COJ15_28355 [Bacillus thuringiensis]